MSGREDEDVGMKVQSSVQSIALWSRLKTQWYQGRRLSGEGNGTELTTEHV